MQAQNEALLKPGRVIFYNVENLFDTINDPITKDEDFLPEAKDQWNTKKYQTKLQHIARVITTMCDTVQPLVIGLCEIENKKVLEDLLAQPALKKYNFGIVHHDSPDERGIDVALLYNKDLLEEVFDATLKVEFSFDKNDRTRDILYFKAYAGEEFPIWFFVDHWPSRREGREESDPKRLATSKILKAKIENIFLGEPYSRIVIMGDFNDNPTDESLLNLSTGKVKLPEHQTMVNLMKPLFDKKEFTIRHMSDSSIFDQLIVSKNLLDSKNQYSISNGAAHIFNPNWLLFNHPKWGMIPNRTYAGGKYVGGYSDHLPVYLDLIFK